MLVSNSPRLVYKEWASRWYNEFLKYATIVKRLSEASDVENKVHRWLLQIFRRSLGCKIVGVDIEEGIFLLCGDIPVGMDIGGELLEKLPYEPRYTKEFKRYEDLVATRMNYNVHFKLSRSNEINYGIAPENEIKFSNTLNPILEPLIKRMFKKKQVNVTSLTLVAINIDEDYETLVLLLNANAVVAGEREVVDVAVFPYKPETVYNEEEGGLQFGIDELPEDFIQELVSRLPNFDKQLAYTLIPLKELALTMTTYVLY